MLLSSFYVKSEDFKEKNGINTVGNSGREINVSLVEFYDAHTLALHNHSGR